MRLSRRIGPLVALTASLGLLAAGCGSQPEGDASLTVYLSAPLRGPEAAAGRDLADGARLALADAGGEAGGVDVTLEIRNDAVARGWDAAEVGANARLATEDTTAIAYIGELGSGASRTSIPITNQAGMLQVSPGAGAEDLTRDSLGSDDVPAVQATGERTFGRVIPSDRDQGEAAAVWMAGEGVSTVAIASDDSDFAKALIAGLGSAPEALEQVTAEDPADAVYVAAEAVSEPGAGDPGERSIYVSDALIDGETPLVSHSRPVRATSAALDASQLPPAADDFLASFAETYDREPGRYAAYGYEAMAVVLDSIDRAGDPTKRSDVVDAFFATEDRDSILGEYSVDGVGNTTLGQLGAYEIGSSGRPEPTAEPLELP